MSEGSGKGSEFIVRLPRLADARPGDDEPAVPPTRGARHRVLIIDDNQDAREVLAMSAGAIMGAFVLRGMVIAADSDTAAIIGMLGVTGGLINAVQTTMYALAAQIYPTVVRATGVGSAMAVGRSGAILSSYIGAWALGAGGTSLFFLLIGSSMTICFIALAFIRRHIAGAERHPTTAIRAKTETL